MCACERVRVREQERKKEEKGRPEESKCGVNCTSRSLGLYVINNLLREGKRHRL